MINDSTQYIARISYGKDSLKMLEVIKSRGLPLDRITTTDVWATDTISANLPPMMAFKDRMDQRIWDMYRIEVEHLCALNKDGSKRTYEQMFYHIPVRRSQIGQVERERDRLKPGSILGFPDLWNPWCQAGLKRNAYAQSPGDNYRIPSQHRVQLVPEAQTIQPGARSRDGHSATRQCDGANIASQVQGKDPMGSQYRYLHGAGNSKSTRSRHPLCGAPHEAQRQKYRGIPWHRCG